MSSEGLTVHSVHSRDWERLCALCRPSPRTRGPGSWRGSRGAPGRTHSAGPSPRTPLRTRNGPRKMFTSLNADTGVAETRKSPVPARPRPRPPVHAGARRPPRPSPGPLVLPHFGARSHSRLSSCHCPSRARGPQRPPPARSTCPKERGPSQRGGLLVGLQGLRAHGGLLVALVSSCSNSLTWWSDKAAVGRRHVPLDSSGPVRMRGPGPPRSQGCSGPLRGGRAMRLANRQADPPPSTSSTSFGDSQRDSGQDNRDAAQGGPSFLGHFPPAGGGNAASQGASPLRACLGEAPGGPPRQRRAGFGAASAAVQSDKCCDSREGQMSACLSSREWGHARARSPRCW